MKRKFPNLRLESVSTKGYYFGAYENAEEEAKKGYQFFISTTPENSDWCECMGYIHGKICYHLKEAKKRFEAQNEK